MSVQHNNRDKNVLWLLSFVYSMCTHKQPFIITHSWVLFTKLCTNKNLQFNTSGWKMLRFPQSFRSFIVIFKCRNNAWNYFQKTAKCEMKACDFVQLLYNSQVQLEDVRFMRGDIAICIFISLNTFFLLWKYRKLKCTSEIIQGIMHNCFSTLNYKY